MSTRESRYKIAAVVAGLVDIVCIVFVASGIGGYIVVAGKDAFADAKVERMLFIAALLVGKLYMVRSFHKHDEASRKYSWSESQMDTMRWWQLFGMMLASILLVLVS